MKIKNMFISIVSILTVGVLFVGCADTAPKAPVTLKSDNKKVSIIQMDNYKIHTYYGVSNSHIIETPNKLIMVDAQFNFKLAKPLNAYIQTLKKPLDRIIISHAHPDHWYGYPIFDAPTVTTPNVVEDLAFLGPIFLKIHTPKMGKIIPKKVVPAKPIVKLGKQNWDGLEVIVEEYANQEAPHSILIKIPEYGVLIGQDLFYNDVHLVAGNRENNKNWVKILASFNENEAKSYKTILTGHGSSTNPEVFNEDIEYLEALEEILESGASKEEVKQELIKRFPDKGAKFFINITTNGLFRKH
jgi:glyoxylase-like metal-dependent hydrolase (beta-lactamase superfamily II)